MISRKRKLVVFHIPKTGGTSIARAFRERKAHDLPHAVFRKLGQRYWDEYLKAAVCRDPWARIHSHYRHRRRTNIYHSPRKDPFAHLPFKDWVLNWNELMKQHPDHSWRPMPHDVWTVYKGKDTTDFLLRFENLQEDFDKMCMMARVRSAPRLPHINKSPRKVYSYCWAYTSQTRKIVKEWESWVIKKMGYKFQEK